MHAIEQPIESVNGLLSSIPVCRGFAEVQLAVECCLGRGEKFPPGFQADLVKKVLAAVEK